MGRPGVSVVRGAARGAGRRSQCTRISPHAPPPSPHPDTPIRPLWTPCRIEGDRQVEEAPDEDPHVQTANRKRRARRRRAVHGRREQVQDRLEGVQQVVDQREEVKGGLGRGRGRAGGWAGPTSDPRPMDQFA